MKSAVHFNRKFSSSVIRVIHYCSRQVVTLKGHWDDCNVFDKSKDGWDKGTCKK